MDQHPVVRKCASCFHAKVGLGEMVSCELGIFLRTNPPGKSIPVIRINFYHTMACQGRKWEEA